MLLLTLHHIVSDGWSTAILVRELQMLYAAFHEGKPSPLPELAIQYADYAIWQREWLQGETLQEHLAYWTNQLAGVPPTLEFAGVEPSATVNTGDSPSELTAERRVLRVEQPGCHFIRTVIIR